MQPSETNWCSDPSAAGAIIMPALNEESVIKALIADIQSAVTLPIWVVDDCSADGTAERATQCGARVITLPVQLGAWAATQAGIREAASRGLEFVVTMDADGQHNPSDIASLVQPVMQGDCDVAIGSAPARGSKLRRLAWRLMRLTSGLRCDDTHFAQRRRVVADLLPTA